MIGPFEIGQASRDHLLQMVDPEGVFRSLAIDHEALKSLEAVMLEVRQPGEYAKSPEHAYLAGFIDGFVLGIKAQCSESVALCEACGNGISRLDKDPIPENFDPTKMEVLCQHCILAQQAAMN